MDLFDLRLWINFAKAGGNLSKPAWINQVSIDSRAINSNTSLFVALKGEKQDGHFFLDNAIKNGAKFAFVSQLYAKEHPEITLLRVPDPLQALHEITRTYRQQLPTKIIGITGSFGKTMVKDLLLKFLSKRYQCVASPESFNSQIGVPLSLLNVERKHEFAIIEAAISKKSEIEKLIDLISPDYSILTPIGRKHLATLDNFETVVEELSKFIAATSLKGWALIPSEPLIENTVALSPLKIYFWDIPETNLPHATSLATKGHPSPPYEVTFPNHKEFFGTSTKGHNYFINLINMAVKAAWILDISYEEICQVLREFTPEPNHTEIWRSPRGAVFVNEPYCSDPQSLDKALNHFNYATSNQRKIFVFGGIRMDPDYAALAYRRIGKSIANAAVDELILYGNHEYQELIDEVRSQSKNTTISQVSEQTEAFSFLSNKLEANDYVIIKGDKKIPLENLTEIFHESLSNNQCFINLAAIQNNVNMIRQSLAAETRLMIMVKAFAYGTDDERLAKYLSSIGINILGVSYVDEGIALKRQGISQSIFAVNAAIYEISKVVKWDLEVGVSDKEFIDALAKESALQNKIVKVHLHLDTGMGRFGCRPEQALELAQLISSAPSLELEGLMTHFACADDPKEDKFTFKQIKTFDQVIADLKNQGIQAKWLHAANSSATLRFKLPQYNMVRVGLATFGLSLSKSVKDQLDLRLALTLTSRIVGINHCKKGETVSYSKSYTIGSENQKVAVLPIGYFDGLHRKYSGKSHVIIRGQPAPMIGNICMDYMMVDVTHIAGASIGDQALIFGQDEYGHYLSPEELAIKGDSIIHELITCLGPRIQRIFVDEESFQIH